MIYDPDLWARVWESGEIYVRMTIAYGINCMTQKNVCEYGEKIE